MNLLALWRRIEGNAINYFGDQLAANKATIVAEVTALVPEGNATLEQFNHAIGTHVSPLARGIVDALLRKEEQAGEDIAIHDAPAFIDKLVAECHATAAKLLGAS